MLARRSLDAASEANRSKAEFPYSEPCSRTFGRVKENTAGVSRLCWREETWA